METGNEIWETASLLVDQAGDEAPKCASRWAHALLEAGDIESRADWMRIMVACKALLAERGGMRSLRRRGSGC
jgi:hypothetical protein